MTMRILSSFLLAAASVVAPVIAGAQGTLSTQGFGYPTGGMSARALGTGGAITEFDPLSATNPAAIPSIGGGALYIQAEPEYRSLKVGGGAERAMIARHPLATIAVPLPANLMGAVSVSNLLDRSFETNERRTQVIGDSVLSTSNFFKSDGAIGDVRVALSWVPKNWIRLGLAGHAITGDNRLRSTQTFDDSARFAAIIDTTTVTYVGAAVSAGVTLFVRNAVGLAASYRKGGSMSVKHADTTLGKANVPDRMSFSAAFVGIPGTTVAVRTSKDTWTRMRGLGSSTLPINEGWDTSVGADVLGPRWGTRSLQIRAGGRWRTLPFGLPTTAIREKTANFGLGTTFSRGRIGLDVSGIRAFREPVSGLSDLRETAWTISAGLTVRP